MATIQEINSTIIAGGFTNEQLDSIVMAVKFARNQLGRSIKFNLKVGDKVEFTSSRTGKTMQGTVRKIAVKFVTVDTNQGGWRVPSSMLRVV